MASTIRFAFAPAGGRCGNTNVGIMSPYPSASGEVASGATSAKATATSASYVAGRADAITIRNDGGAVWVKFGADPTASVNGAGCIFIADGERAYYGPVSEGDTFAVIDDA